jgi:hypothetical protein
VRIGTRRRGGGRGEIEVLRDPVQHPLILQDAAIREKKERLRIRAVADPATGNLIIFNLLCAGKTGEV